MKPHPSPANQGELTKLDIAVKLHLSLTNTPHVDGERLVRWIQTIAVLYKISENKESQNQN